MEESVFKNPFFYAALAVGLGFSSLVLQMQEKFPAVKLPGLILYLFASPLLVFLGVRAGILKYKKGERNLGVTGIILNLLIFFWPIFMTAVGMYILASGRFQFIM